MYGLLIPEIKLCLHDDGACGGAQTLATYKKNDHNVVISWTSWKPPCGTEHSNNLLDYNDGLVGLE